MIDIVLVDDHKIIRDGIKSFLKEENDFRVIGEGSNGKEILTVIAEKQPDVLLIDINMSDLDGHELTKIVKEKYPEVKILVLSMLDHEQCVVKMMDAGASGYALKNIGKEELFFAIRMVAGGSKFICSAIGLSLLSKVKAVTVQPHLAVPEMKTELSQREIEVLRNIAEGLTNAEIADKLFTSKRTIESHRQNIIDKTNVKNTASLIKFAIKNGLID